MHIRGQAPVLWRSQGQWQIGVSSPIILTNLTPAEERLLGALPRHLGKEAIYRASRRAGLSSAGSRALIERLVRAGAIVEAQPASFSADAVHRERMGQDPVARRTTLRGKVVTVLGDGPLVLSLAHLLACAEVGTVVTEDVGTRLHLHRSFPQVRTDTAAARRSDLVVLVTSYVIDPVRERSLTQHGVPHLPVVCADVGVDVGPLLDDDAHLCRACLEMWACEEDPCWPAVATQARALEPPCLEHLTVQRAGNVAAQAVLDVLTGAAEPWRSQQVLIRLDQAVPGRRVCRPHPQCLCAAEGRSGSAGTGAELTPALR